MSRSKSVPQLWLTTWVKSWEMAMTAPVVIASRLTRLAVAGPSPSSRDRKELVRMGQEKLDASVESIQATAAAIGNANERLLRIMVVPALTGGAPGCAGVTQSLLRSWFQVLDRSIAPFHRRVMSNEVRLIKS